MAEHLKKAMGSSSKMVLGIYPVDFGTFAFAAIFGWFLSQYLNIDATVLVWLAAAALEFFAARYLCRCPLRGKLANFLVGLFSALFTVSLILGEHIVVEDAYSGLSDVNYISSYSTVDVWAFVFIFLGVFALSAAPVAYVRGEAPTKARVLKSRWTHWTPDGWLYSPFWYFFFGFLI